MLIQFALTLTVLLAFCGLALDVGLLELKQLQMQNAADAAALGASYTLGTGATASAWQAAGQADAALNGFMDGANGTTVTLAKPTTGSYAGNPLAVRATISQTVNPIFVSGARAVSAQATALAAVSGCMYIFSQTFTQPSIDATNAYGLGTCAAYLGLGYSFVNQGSRGPQYFISGNPPSSGYTSPQPVFNVPGQPDPLGYLGVPPSKNTCDYTNTSITGSSNPPLNQGTYCGGISINNATVTFNPGVYIIAGDFNILGSSNVTANGVTFYMTKISGHPSGLIHFDTATVYMTAPTSGPYQGIIIYSDRALTPGQKILSVTSVNTSSTVDGIVYLPGQELYTTNEGLSGVHYFGIVADYYYMNNGGFELSSDYSSLEKGNPFHPRGGGLVQ